LQNRLNRFLRIALSLSLVLSGVPFRAQGQVATSGRYSAFRDFEAAAVPLAKKTAEQLEEYQRLEAALISRNLSQIPKDIIDPTFLLGQSMTTVDGRTFDLTSPNGTAPLITPERFDYKLENGQLVILALRGSQVIAKQTLSAAKNFVSIGKDSELVVAVTDDGNILALDTGLVRRLAFKSAVPLFTLFRSGSTGRLAVAGASTKATFMSRGLRPFTLDEINTPMSNGLPPVVPRNDSGEVLLQAGDLTVYNQVGTKRELLGIFNRKALLTHLSTGVVTFAVQATLFSHAGYLDSFEDRRERSLMIEGKMPLGTLTLLENVLSLAEDESRQAEIEKLSQKLLEVDPLATMVFKSFKRSDLKAMINRARESKKRPESFRPDEFTVDQWLSSYDQIAKESEQEIVRLRQAAETHAAGTIDRDRIESEISAITEQSEAGDFRQTYRSLSRNAITGHSVDRSQRAAWYKRIDWKSVRQITAKTSAAGLALWASGKGVQHFFPVEFSLMLNWMTEHAVPEAFKATYKGVPYWKPAIAGSALLMLLMPASTVIGWASAPFIQWLGHATESLSRFIPLASLKDRLKKSASKIRAWGDAISPLTTWQRIVTGFTRPYAYIVLPFFNWVDQYFVLGAAAALVGKKIPEHRRQNIMASLRAGVSPLTVVRGNTPLGRAIGLEKDESVRTGVSNPLKGQAEAERTRDLQNKALFQKSEARRKAFTLGWVLSTITVAKKSGIDPATLVALRTGRLTIEELKKISADPKLLSTWQVVAEATSHQILSILESENIELNPEDTNLMARLGAETDAIAEKVMSESGLEKTLHWMKRKYNQIGFRMMTGSANYAQEDFAFLKSVVASPFVADQTRQGFQYDHLMTVGIPMAWGDRADMNHPEQLAHDPSVGAWRFYSTPNHLMDMFQNLMVHLLMAGPRKTLIYQRPKDVKEHNYDPLTESALTAAPRPESFFRGALTWLTTLVKRTPDLNFGGYYMYGFYRKMTTIQAGFLLTMASRLWIANQSLEHAFIGFWMTFFAATVAYGWPWEIVERGNNFEEERVAENEAKVNSLVLSVSEAIRKGDRTKAEEGLQNLFALYAQENQPGLQSLVKLVQDAQKVSGEKTRHVSDRIKNALGDARKNTKLMAAVAEMAKAQKSNDPEVIRAALATLQNVLETEMDTKEVKNLLEAVEAEAGPILDFVIENPPLYNKPNRWTADSVTFTLGAVLTTYLAIGLMVESTTTSSLTWGTVATKAVENAVFLGATFAMLSKYMWTKYYTPFWDKQLAPQLQSARGALNSQVEGVRSDLKNLKEKCMKLLSGR
jgi:hypothetical protein